MVKLCFVPNISTLKIGPANASDFVSDSVFQFITYWLSTAVLVHKQDTPTSREKQYKAALISMILILTTEANGKQISFSVI